MNLWAVNLHQSRKGFVKNYIIYLSVDLMKGDFEGKHKII